MTKRVRLKYGPAVLNPVLLISSFGPAYAFHLLLPICAQNDARFRAMLASSRNTERHNFPQRYPSRIFRRRSAMPPNHRRPPHPLSSEHSCFLVTPTPPFPSPLGLLESSR